MKVSVNKKFEKVGHKCKNPLDKVEQLDYIINSSRYSTFKKVKEVRFNGINNRPVSDNILRIISERGYKQSAVARKAGYSRQTFGYMVHNTRIIRPEDVQRIAFALGVEPGELFKDADLGA